MKKKTNRRMRRMLQTFLMFVLAVSLTVIPVFAASPGVYTATATAHYRHPVTGNIEDSGGEDSEALGQAMTESALYKTALVEVDSSGDTYITVRLQLMDNIENPTFKVSKGGSSSFSGVSVKQMQASGNTADFRMKVSDENVIIRCSMDVIAMGRPVIFYITVSGLKSGHGDFVTSINTESTSESSTSESSSASESSSTSESSSASKSSSASQSRSSSESTSSAEKNSSSAVSSSEEAEDNTEKAGEEHKEQQDSEGNLNTETENKDENVEEETGIEEFDENGKEADPVDQTEQSVQKRRYMGIIAGIVIAAGAAAAGWYFGFYRKNRH